jgi:hypothetical protein
MFFYENQKFHAAKGLHKKRGSYEKTTRSDCHAELFDGTATVTDIGIEMQREFYSQGWFSDCRHRWLTIHLQNMMCLPEYIVCDIMNGEESSIRKGRQ